MELFDKIRTLRIHHSMTQRELSLKMHVSEVSIRNWETGIKKPSVVAIIELAKIFNVSTDYLLGIHQECTTPIFSISKREQKLLNNYKQLDKHGKSVVDAVCSLEKSRITSQDNIIEIQTLRRHIPLYHTPAAAGQSFPFDVDDFDLLLRDENTPSDADFAVKIQGNSMSPYIQDGDIVYVKKDCELSIGDVGIFCFNGVIYCKQYFIDNHNNIILVSANSSLRDTNVKIQTNDDLINLKCYGKVLLKNKIKIPEYVLI